MILIGHDAAAQTDSLYMSLDSTTFVSQRHTSAIKRVDSRISSINLDRIQSLPGILGNTDPVNFIKNLPGVQTGSEYDSGIHIQGCDNAHNDISLAGVPVYGANHLFGFFSVFNPGHHTNMRFSRSSEENRIGGMIMMELPDTLEEIFSGEISVGIMSSQGTMALKTGEKSHLKISARQSYMNLLYKKWMKIEKSPIRYGFGDYNLTWLYMPSAYDRIWIDAYIGQDNAVISTTLFSVSMKEKWGNHAGAVHWEHKGEEITHHHTFYSSGYESNGLMTQDESSLSLSSFIRSTGYKGSLLWRSLRGKLSLTFHDVLPQYPELDGLYDPKATDKEQQKAFEASISGGYKTTFADSWGVDAFVRGTFYLSPEMEYDLSLSPDISISYDAHHLGKITASCGIHHQHLFQVGLSNIGLPIEFWFMAGKHSLPQHSRHADISYEIDLFNDAVSFSANAYYKRLFNMAEYRGDMFDFFNSNYDLDSHLLKGDGWNYGLNFMAHKQSGDFTGWISYSLGRALRRFDNPDYCGIYPANHERIHELNAVCAYKMRKWNLSGTFVYASGIPFTAPEHYYISSGQIISQPGEHNDCRMRPYIRLDLSATYFITKTDRHENGINISLYNATGRRNDVMYRLNTYNGNYSYGSMSFFLRWVPSISFFHKF